MLNLRGEPSRVINRAIDFQSVSFPEDKIIETVTRRGVDTARTSFAGRFIFAGLADIELSFGVCFTAERNMLAQHQE